MESIRRFFSDSSESFFILGPRGTGKSTWLRNNYPNSLKIDLLDPEFFRMYSARPERIFELVSGNPDKNVVIIDEVQKVPDLLPAVHKLIEEKKGRRFILTGSSTRKLKKAGVDTLAGRAIHKSFHPFMASELGTLFDLEKNLKIGMIPLVLAAQSPSATLNSYASLYLRDEIQAEGIVRNIGAFSRFLESISFSHASVLNISEVARECQVERKTVEGYVDILEDMLLSFRVPVFTKRAKRHLISHQKFYFFDSGVYNSLRPKGHLDRPEEMAGHALEGLVAQHLRAWASYSDIQLGIYYWRTKSGNEVDFVLYGENIFKAIEVKSSKTLSSKDLNGLRAFASDYPEASLLLLYGGKDRLMIDSISCMPITAFLKDLVPGKPIP